MIHKISICFFNDREVRAAWDDSTSQWLFSIADIVGVLTESVDPRKYWSVLKSRLNMTYPELTTCSQLKMTAADGKRYKCIDWSKVNKDAYLEAMRKSVADSTVLKALLEPALTRKINDRDMFMKGIDSSFYYYESDNPSFEPRRNSN